MVRKDFYIGKTHIIIDDEFCVKTQEEVDAILARIANKVYENLVAYEIKKQKERDLKNKSQE